MSSPNSLLVVNSVEKSSPDTFALLEELAKNGQVVLPGGRTVTMHPTARIIGVVTESDKPLPKHVGCCPLMVHLRARTKNEIVNDAAKRFSLGIYVVERLFCVFEEVQRLVEGLPQSERRLTIKQVVFTLICML